MLPDNLEPRIAGDDEAEQLASGVWEFLREQRTLRDSVEQQAVAFDYEFKFDHLCARRLVGSAPQ